MTLNKSAVRGEVDTFFDRFGSFHRFEFDSNERTVTIVAQSAKQRIPHGAQALISEVVA